MFTWLEKQFSRYGWYIDRKLRKRTEHLLRYSHMRKVTMTGSMMGPITLEIDQTGFGNVPIFATFRYSSLPEEAAFQDVPPIIVTWFDHRRSGPRMEIVTRSDAQVRFCLANCSLQQAQTVLEFLAIAAELAVIHATSFNTLDEKQKQEIMRRVEYDINDVSIMPSILKQRIDEHLLTLLGYCRLAEDDSLFVPILEDDPAY